MTVYLIFYIALFSLCANASNEELSSKIKMRLYRNGNNTDFEEFLIGDGAERLEMSLDFDKAKPTVFVIPGVNMGANKRLVRAIVDSFGTSGKYKNYNILAQHLPRIFKNKLRSDLVVTAVPWTEAVGKIIGDFLLNMVRRGLTVPGRIYMIGYCWGSHVAGYAARQVLREFNEPVEYIAGLDPLSIGYDLVFGMSTLTHQDARIVHQYHTSSAYITLDGGTADFIFNGGLYQPGCLFDRVLCSHARVVWLFAESVTHEVAFEARSCSSIGAFNMCLCASRETKYITFPPDESASGNYYVRTHTKSPYGAGPLGSMGALCYARYFWK